MKNVGKVIRNIIDNLEVRCPNASCEKQMTLEKYEDHEYICKLPKCQNELCKKSTEQPISVIF